VGGLGDLRARVSASPQETRVPEKLAWDDLFDALDVLDRAIASARAPDPAMAEGLAGIKNRIEGFLAGSHLCRVGAPGNPIDGRLFRVSGTVDLPGLPHGAIAQVVRAAVVRGHALVREGEVLANRRSA
jgi:molecular chaperone GrpE (heat shock protein)